MTLHIRAQPLYTKKWTMAMVVVAEDARIRVHRVDIVALRRLIDRPDGTVIDVATPMR